MDTCYIFSLPLVFATAAVQNEEIKCTLFSSMQNNDIEGALDRYQQYCNNAERYDFEMLQQMGLIMLQKGIQTDDPQTFLMALLEQASQAHLDRSKSSKKDCTIQTHKCSCYVYTSSRNLKTTKPMIISKKR